MVKYAREPESGNTAQSELPFPFPRCLCSFWHARLAPVGFLLAKKPNSQNVGYSLPTAARHCAPPPPRYEDQHTI